MADIKEGNIVRLKSGGVQMTVDSIDEDGANCVWQNGNHTLRELFRVHTLELASKQDGISVKLGRA